MKNKLLNLILILILLNGCVGASSKGVFGTGVSVALDPRTVGTQIDDGIMDKNLDAKLLLMNKNYFEIKRAGINTTFQDQGRGNLYHIGIPFSGAMDNRNFQISNKLVGNEVNFPIIEFAYQGPLLKYFGENINFAITGDVKFIIRKKNNTSKYRKFSNK